MSSATIALPAGNDSTVNLLATAVNGNQPNQTFIVTLHRWHQLELHAKLERLVHPAETTRENRRRWKWLTASHRPEPPTTDRSTLYGYSFAINSAKTVQSITLPNNRNVVVLAHRFDPRSGGPAARGEPDVEPGCRDLHLGAIGHARRYARRGR